MTETDPEGLLTPSPHVVKVVGTAREDMNGQIGLVTGFNAERGRYTVKLSNNNNILSLKATNLQKAGQVDKMKYHIQSQISTFNQLRNDPQLRQQFMQIYQLVSSKLPSYLPPERAAIVALVLFVLAIRTFGFYKVFMITSLLSLPIVVSIPDLINGKSVRETARNFPRNWRNSIAESTGWNSISERVALAGFVVLLALSVKILVTSSSPVPSAPPAAPPTSASSSSSSSLSTSSQGRSFTLEEVYRLGFEDATEGKTFGTSFPEEGVIAGPEGVVTSASSSSSSSSAADIDWEYNAPPTRPPPRTNSRGFDGLFGGGGGGYGGYGGGGSKMGIGTMFSLFHLGRTAFSLSRGPDGRPDLNLLVVNLKRLESWRLGLLALSLFKVVSTFM